MNIRVLTLPALALALACTLAPAQSASSRAGFRCGGVGLDEQAQFKAEAARHHALLTFALSSGAYLSDVDFRVADGRGNVVLEGRCDGPLMLLDLPGRGSYQVTATYEGKAQRKTVAVGTKPTRATFVWPGPA